MSRGAGRPVVLLHVGTPKTGTTYLQDVLWCNRRTLRRSGVLYPGQRPQSQFLAVMDLQGATADEVGAPDLPGSWHRLLDQIRGWPGTAVISHELLAPMDTARIDRVHDDLGFAEVHVVCTVRDLGRQLPAVWQEDLKNRHSLRFAEFLDAVRTDAGQRHWLGDLFWRMQDVPEVLRRWASVVPPERVHVVTVPPPGGPAAQLWERFATLLGVDHAAVDATPDAPNSSLGPAEAHLLRRINLALDPALPWPVYERTVRRHLVDVLARRPGGVSRISVPAADLGWVRERSERITKELNEAGYRIVGDLDDLTPAVGGGSAHPGAHPGAHPDDVTDSDLLDAALAAVRMLVEREAAAPAPRLSGATLRWRVSELAGRHRGLLAARSLYRSVRRLHDERRG
ncbi:MAG: hypothetical protein GEU83_02705 [Pseudonocardiaceae bacterium]|nr:hypothetical protein [Pseudonocardiaceae bacterium]